MTIRRAAACLAIPLLLSGCLIPEKFVAKANFADDGSYVFTYDGSAVHALAAAQLNKTGKLTDKDEAGLRAEVDKIKKMPDVSSIRYKGNGRYGLTMESRRKRGEALKALNILFVKTAKDGVTTASSAEVTPRDQKGLAELNIKLDGVLEVRLPKNAQIISHNATTTPGLLGAAYGWKIGDIKQRPSISFRLKS
jgi:hypothetical protein